MSILSQINRIKGNIDDSLDEVALKGVTVPAGSNSDDLPGLIHLIEQSGGSGVGGVIYQDEDGYLVLSEEAANVIGITRTLDENGGEILDIVGVSLAEDTVTPETLAQGVTAHNAAGEAIVGTMSGGGSSVLSGTYTPAENTTGPTFAVGKDVDHFIIYALTYPGGNSIKVFYGAVLDFTLQKPCWIMLASNNTGTSIAGYVADSATGNFDWFQKSGTNIVCTNTSTSGAGNAGYWAAGITYQWYAW